MTKDLINRITYHLSSGGLFNPELADHLAVRNLLMECREALAQPEQDWIERERAVGYREGHQNALKQMAQPEQEPDWKGLVLSHNEDCESRCDMDRCGYKPYYEYNGRRCPDCPIHEKIWVEYTPPQRKPLTDEQKDRLANAWFSKDGDTDVSHRKAIALIEEVEAAHGIKE